MFNINHRPTFTVDVPVLLPGMSDGQSLKTTFRAISDEEAATHTADPEGLKRFLCEVIVAFHDLVDDDNNPVAYTDAIRDQQLGFAHMRLRLNQAYWEALFKARTGN